jgi:hypothetical protein
MRTEDPVLRRQSTFDDEERTPEEIVREELKRREAGDVVAV